jgi:hypothetical protein
MQYKVRVNLDGGDATIINASSMEEALLISTVVAADYGYPSNILENGVVVR